MFTGLGTYPGSCTFIFFTEFLIIACFPLYCLPLESLTQKQKLAGLLKIVVVRLRAWGLWNWLPHKRGALGSGREASTPFVASLFKQTVWSFSLLGEEAAETHFIPASRPASVLRVCQK